MDDLTALISYLSDIYPTDEPFSVVNADMDQNGTVGMDDLIEIINLLLHN